MELSTRKLSKKDEEERAAWLLRRPWPVLILGIDPGAEAGATIMTPDRSTMIIHEVETMTRQVDRVVEEAVTIAREQRLLLVPIIEEWGAGGKRGIDQWLGLGAAYGAWRRQLVLAWAEGANDVLRKDKNARALQSRWRSRMIAESGKRVGGAFKPFDSEEWKKAATRTLVSMFPGIELSSANGAESALIAIYGQRCDEVGALIPKRLLAEHGFAA
jgi:hypothetical protein